jgi:Ca2+-binding RTX toxin-like protein
VGPGHPYAKPCAAIAVAAPGDTIQIDAAGNGGYNGDTCGSSVANLTIEGINGRAHIDATGTALFQSKGIWVLSGPGTTVRNVELSGAAISLADGANGAAIRVQGSGDLTLTGSYLHDNQHGILVGGSATDSDITIESSEFAQNGNTDGSAHNIYVATAHSFIMRYSYSHGAKLGHLLKSDAATNDIRFNRLTGESSTSSFELDLPKAGLSYVIGNVIEQGPSTNNTTMLSYGEEGLTNTNHKLYVVNNTFVNDRSSGGVAVHVAAGADPASLINNIKAGPGTFVDQGTAVQAATCAPLDAMFVAPASYDYHLQPSSPCRDFGTAPDASLAPTEQYVYDEGHQPRTVVGSAPDAGAFEYAPPDTDGDGLPDAGDSCPAQSDASAPRNPRDGCPAVAPPPPPDADGDGIPDSSDACPSQSDLAAQRNPRTGCPVEAGPPPPAHATNGKDNLDGTAHADVICGLLGNDTINGLGGNDTLWGDACGDKVKALLGSAAVKDGKDTLNGGSGSDKLYGAGGNDKLSGGAGNDKLFGGGGTNKYSGGSGNDTVNARNKKKETVNCGSGKKDVAIVDKKDKVKGCEKVKRARR